MVAGVNFCRAYGENKVFPLGYSELFVYGKKLLVR